MSAAPRILLVIADAMLRQTLAEHLGESAGMAVVQAGTAAEGRAGAAGCDLIILDETIGLDECDDRAAPLLLLCAAATAPALRPGDAAMTKPLRLAALVAKINDLLNQPPPSASLRLGGWRLDAARRVLTDDDGRTVRLTDKEVAILNRLARAEGAVVGREAMLADVWGYSSAMDTHTLETHIYRLRRKIGPGESSDLLVSEGGGYRLVVAP